LPQDLIGALALGDVPKKTHKPSALGGLVLDADFDVKNAAVLAAVPGLENDPLPAS